MFLLLKLFFDVVFSLTAVFAQGASGCPNGTYSVVTSPDGGTISILFDSFKVEAGGSTGLDMDRKSCNLSVPLVLPAGYSIGVYKVDYRGFAQLSEKQHSELLVDYALGPHDNGRIYRRKVKGIFLGDFFLPIRLSLNSSFLSFFCGFFIVNFSIG